MSLRNQYICNWLVHWKHDPASFFSEGLIAMRYYPVWKRSFEVAVEPFGRSNPWLAGNVIAFLKSNVQPGHHIFEWGSGSSTIFFARMTNHVYSVEHDNQWYNRVQQAIQDQHLSHAHCMCIAPEKDGKHRSAEDPGAFGSHKAEWDGWNYEAYVRSINRFPDNHFHWICVDGRARPSCLIAAIPKLKPGGWLMLDNAARAHYQKALELFTSWRCRRLIGPVCRSRNFVETRFMQKPSQNESIFPVGIAI